MYVNMLKHFNLMFAGVDIGPNCIVDHRGLTPEEQRDWIHHKHKLPMAQAFSMVLPGQFVQSHQPPVKNNVNVKQLLKGWKKVFTCRNLRYTLISHMRWLPRAGVKPQPWFNLPDGPKKMLAYVKDPGLNHLIAVREKIKWLKEDVVLIRFESLVNAEWDEQYATLDKLSNYLGVHPDYDRVLEEVGKKTMTSTGKLSTLDQYWNDELEEWFIENGGNTLNKKLGYEK